MHFVGGDDVQQLCEAGEEEFLEIMALVGMASKPLHVRRLQKALQEWVANPSKYRISSVIKRSFFSFQNNPKDLDPSYKTDLNLWDCLGTELQIRKEDRNIFWDDFYYF